MRPGATWRDAVPRWRAFERAHPDVNITSGGAPGYWQAAVPEEGSVRYLTRYELSDLLDVLRKDFEDSEVS